MNLRGANPPPLLIKNLLKIRGGVDRCSTPPCKIQGGGLRPPTPPCLAPLPRTYSYIVRSNIIYIIKILIYIFLSESSRK